MFNEKDGDKWEPVWDSIYSKSAYRLSFSNMYKYGLIIKLIKKFAEDGGLVLEPGCGSGFILGQLSNMGFKCVGLDYRKEALRVSKETSRNVEFIRGDIFSMPYQDNSFDIVWNDGVLEHYKSARAIAACKEMKRIAKRYVIIGVPNRWTVWTYRKLV